MEQAHDIRKLVAPENSADHISHAGTKYQASEDGTFEVPVHVAAELVHHGFVEKTEAAVEETTEEETTEIKQGNKAPWQE